MSATNVQITVPMLAAPSARQPAEIAIQLAPREADALRCAYAGLISTSTQYPAAGRPPVSYEEALKTVLAALATGFSL